MTPVPDIEKFLNAFDQYETIFSDFPKVLDPCAGGDSSHPMSYPTAIENVFYYPVDTIDIREDSLAAIKADYLTYAPAKKYDVIITNPPFNIALDIINKALKDVADGGFVIMLVRLNFFGSRARHPFFEENMPKYCFVHHERMSFTDGGQTDSIEYCHMVWQKGYNRNTTQLVLI